MGYFIKLFSQIVKVFRKILSLFHDGGSMAKQNQSEGVMNTIIGKGTKIEGQMEVAQSIRIDGSFKGTLTASETLIIGTSGEMNDVTVKVKNAIIGGKIKGKVTALNKVTLESTSTLDGDLTAKLLIIEEGALFSGNCASGDKVESQPSQLANKRFDHVK